MTVDVQQFVQKVRNDGSAESFRTEADEKFRDLMRRMHQALQREDRELARALDPGTELGKEYSRRGAPGLAYWVFEHNLVYSIFKEWAPRYRVLWDERPGALWSEFEPVDRAPAAKNASRKLVDLQVVDEKGDARWYFEAKWMNNSSGVGGATRDITKLNEISNGEAGPHRRFVIGIWCNSADKLETDLADQRRWQTDKVLPMYSGAFASRVPSKTKGEVEPGHIFIAVWELSLKA